ncbi:hypothetical protein A3Q56_01558 [Intoshia linei]|uniref:Uncharacterized protein n=1 Tax=Intoshia linei TaxID=1819745 RepID=A0A177BAM8_9BILA|nr:hypothetical protein A3Q56_01558 [Intoshia linei]
MLHNDYNKKLKIKISEIERRYRWNLALWEFEYKKMIKYRNWMATKNEKFTKKYNQKAIETEPIKTYPTTHQKNFPMNQKGISNVSTHNLKNVLKIRAKSCKENKKCVSNDSIPKYGTVPEMGPSVVSLLGTNSDKSKSNISITYYSRNMYTRNCTSAYHYSNFQSNVIHTPLNRNCTKSYNCNQKKFIYHYQKFPNDIIDRKKSLDEIINDYNIFKS